METDDDLLDLLIGDKVLRDWDREWVILPGGFTMSHREVSYQSGLYRTSIHGEITVVGKAANKKRGLWDQFHNLTRPGSSGRNHKAGRLIYENRLELDLEVLITGPGRAGRELAEALRQPMIDLHRPIWTVPKAIRLAHLHSR